VAKEGGTVTTYPLTYFESLLRRERDDAARVHEAHRLAAAEEALETIHGDPRHYGLCITCGRRIDSDRLTIVPATRYCEDHAERRPPDVASPRKTSVGLASSR
jgi:RNA polymerase-binding transcription factor DksA